MRALLILSFALLAGTTGFANVTCEDALRDQQAELFGARIAAAAPLPLKIHLPSTHHELNSLSTLAVQKFNARFPAPWIIEKVTAIEAGDMWVITKQDFKALKEARKLGQVIRSTYYILSEAHQPPEDFDDLMRVFGKMLDKVKDEKNSATKPAAKVLKRMARGDWDLSKYPNPLVTAESFHEEIAKMKSTIITLMNSQISVKEYHDLRKEIRDLKILFDLILEKNPSTDNQQVASYLGMLNTRLGDVKDDLVEEEHDLEEGSLTTSVSAEDRALIRHLMERF